MSNEDLINQCPTSPKSLQEKLICLLQEELEFDKEYWVPLIFSSIIVALGLLTDNSAVVIGAMLMTPLFWPIFGVTMGTITTRRKLLQKSILFLILSILVVISLSWLVATLTPINEVTKEISLRTQPTLLDLFIALFSSIIAVLVVSYPQISNSIAGVAVSIALLPPLSVIGIGLAFQSWQIFKGASLLFGANMSAIIFSGIATLYFLKVRPRKLIEQKRWRIGMFLSSAFLILISVPLTIYLNQAISQSRMQGEIKRVLQDQIHQLYKNSQINDLRITFDLNEKQANIKSTIYLPEGGYLTISNRNQLSEALSKSVDLSINLQLNVINTMLLRRKEDTQARELRNKIETFLTEKLRNIDPNIEIVNIIVEQAEQQTELDPKLVIMVTARKQFDTAFTFEQKKTVQNSLSKNLNQKVRLEIDFIPVTRIESQDQITQLTSRATEVIKQDLSGISNLAQISNVQVKEAKHSDIKSLFLITANIQIPSKIRFTDAYHQMIEQHLAEDLRKPVQLELMIIKTQPIESDGHYSLPSPEPSETIDSQI